MLICCGKTVFVSKLNISLSPIETFNLILSTKSIENILGGDWHFYCLTWNGKTGIFRFFYDGVIFGNAIEHEKLKTSLPKTGNISVGKTFDQDTSVRISYLNVWSVELTKHSVLAMSAGGLNVNGDAMAWRNVRKGIVGVIRISKSVVVYFPG